MGFRITTNMMRNTYQYNLMNSTNKVADARDQVLTQRNFNSYAEDPAAATQAFRLRREYYQTSSQIANTKDVYSKFNTAWQNLQGMLQDLINPLDKVSIIRGETDTAGESRTALAQVLRESAESMIQGFNQELGGHFIFAGNDGLNAPFTWQNGELFYRGINVNSGGMKPPTAAEPDWLETVRSDGEQNGTWSAEDQEWYDYYMHKTQVVPESAEPTWLDDNAGDTSIPAEERQGWIDYYRHVTAEPPTASDPAEDPADNSKWGPKDENGIPTKMPQYSDDPMEAKWIAYYNDQSDYLKLQAMSEEEMYIDLGMGAEERGDNNPLRGTYFNSALSGLNYTNFGVDEDGDPKNFAMLLRELADVFDDWKESGQKYIPEEYQDKTYDELKNLMEADPAVKKKIEDYHEQQQAKAYRLMDKLKDAQEFLTAEHVELDAQSAYLRTNQSRLELQSTNINEEILEVEQVDLAAAITNFSWDMYCYNAALKIGNQLLSQSLIDYMS